MEPGVLTVYTVATLSPQPDSGLPRRIRDKAGAVYEVRPYRTSDRAALEVFYNDFEPKRAAQGLPPKDAERISRWLDAVLGQGTHLLTFDGSTLVGHALLVPTGQEGISEYAVFLHREYRGRGLGTELNRASIGAAREAGLKGLWLSVEPHNRAALRSYEKAGFTLIPGTLFSSEAEMRLTL
jgi:RimJ/RimL family protein N-acetyltransferase